MRDRYSDSRGDRLESEVGITQLTSPDLWKNRRELPFCRRCGRAFEEKSKHCPRCDRADEMGRLKPVDPDIARRADEKFFRSRR